MYIFHMGILYSESMTFTLVKEERKAEERLTRIDGSAIQSTGCSSRRPGPGTHRAAHNHL